jgi:hypothetical protein
MKFVWCSKNFIMQKSALLGVNASLRWLNNVRGVYLVQVSALASHWLEDCANFAATPEETTNTAPTTLNAIKSTFINAHLYSTYDKWE